MATESTKGEESTSTSSTGEESGKGQQGQQAATPEDGANGTQQASTQQDTGKLSDDHPVVKALAKVTAKSATQATELIEAQAQASKATKLEEELGKRPSLEAVTTLQTRYDRLEGFLQAIGGPLSKALDSRSFSQSLFESDKDIKELVQDWNKANPSATSQALGANGAPSTGSKTDMNALLRSAIK